MHEYIGNFHYYILRVIDVAHKLLLEQPNEIEDRSVWQHTAKRVDYGLRDLCHPASVSIYSYIATP